jgi:single-strand DNA-binding protein
MNKLLINGRLVKDPETNDARSFAKLYVAIKRKFKNKQNNEYESDFLNFIAFGKTAEYILNYVRKGDLVNIEGNVQISSYEKDGEKKSSIQFIVDNLSTLAKSQKNGGLPDGETLTEDPIEAPF